MPAPLLGPALALCLGTAQDPGPAPTTDVSASEQRAAPPPRRRRWLVGVEATALQVPVLRPTVVTLDPRSTGGSTPMGGAGIFGRFRPVPLVGVELSVRSASGRYKDEATSDVASTLLLLSEASVYLYLARGEVAQFALDAGMGGIYNRTRYEVGDQDGTQAWGSGFVRLGADAEFIVKRIAFVLALRGYGVFTDTSRVNNQGGLFSSAPDARAPVTTYQTYVSVTGGLAYRF